MAGSQKPTVEIEGGADQREVGEYLRENTVLRPRAQLLAVTPVVRIAEHLLEKESRLLKITHAGQALNVQNERIENVPS